MTFSKIGYTRIVPSSRNGPIGPMPYKKTKHDTLVKCLKWKQIRTTQHMHNNFSIYACECAIEYYDAECF